MKAETGARQGNSDVKERYWIISGRLTCCHNEIQCLALLPYEYINNAYSGVNVMN
jgi:hypothetical protein